MWRNYLLTIPLLPLIGPHHGIIYLPLIHRLEKGLSYWSSLCEKRNLNLVHTIASMIQPTELRSNLPMKLANDLVSTTTKVWNILVASKRGDLETVKKMGDECHELLYAQYNYTPPIHFAVREGHIDLVKYLLNNGAYDPDYKIYPFQESLETIAHDRGYNEILLLLKQYTNNPTSHKYKGDNGEVHYNRTALQQEFEKAVDNNDLRKTEEILKEHPEFAGDETYFWGEGVLLFSAKENNRKMIDLLMNY